MENKRLPAVVSDAGPLMHLGKINKLYLLRSLFDLVFLTDSVKGEVYDKGIMLGHADAKEIGKCITDGWIRVEVLPQCWTKSALNLQKREHVSRADAETLLLAVHKNAELLVDETLLSNLAEMHGLRVWSTWTVLLSSLQAGYLTFTDVRAAVDDLHKAKFSLNDKQAQELLDDAEIIEKRKRAQK